ncbi:hypothetical protein M9H77_02252 [Catharanthus roseus]|uniref:Uncharacterized protein n=1 Tax=Catharanthus roseus TaxID=4058 RepID=A0ACC0C812_CATRO|nr:hypothetical protein M9H77_02252 [Catharanthus roseus]
MMMPFHKTVHAIGAPWTKSGSPKRGHRNQVLASRSQYQPNTIRALDYKQLHSHITGQNRLQTPGAPTRAICPAAGTDSSHKHYRVVKILIRQLSHAYANFTIMPMPDLYSCMSKYVTFQARTFSNI